MKNESMIRYREYIKERNNYTKVLQRAKREYELNLFVEVKTNPKALYK